jgi:hypothetical protein
MKYAAFDVRTVTRRLRLKIKCTNFPKQILPYNRPRRPTGVAEAYLYSFFIHGARWEQVVNATPRPLYPRERDPVPIVQEAAWAPGPVWTGAEYLVLTGIRSPDPPACRESLYRLSYPGPLISSPYIINTLRVIE